MRSLVDSVALPFKDADFLLLNSVSRFLKGCIISPEFGETRKLRN